jgi:hypothetical protein
VVVHRDVGREADRLVKVRHRILKQLSNVSTAANQPATRAGACLHGALDVAAVEEKVWIGRVDGDGLVKVVQSQVQPLQPVQRQPAVVEEAASARSATTESARRDAGVHGVLVVHAQRLLKAVQRFLVLAAFKVSQTQVVLCIGVAASNGKPRVRPCTNNTRSATHRGSSSTAEERSLIDSSNRPIVRKQLPRLKYALNLADDSSIERV